MKHFEWFIYNFVYLVYGSRDPIGTSLSILILSDNKESDNML